ncbi:hypothetical protein BG004_003362 [Podila humilis]|nr:hypothetical protein BG004_003362 [Podila humilis]
MHMLTVFANPLLDAYGSPMVSGKNYQLVNGSKFLYLRWYNSRYWLITHSEGTASPAIVTLYDSTQRESGVHLQEDSNYVMAFTPWSNRWIEVCGGGDLCEYDDQPAACDYYRFIPDSSYASHPSYRWLSSTSSGSAGCDWFCNFNGSDQTFSFVPV